MYIYIYKANTYPTTYIYIYIYIYNNEGMTEKNKNTFDTHQFIQY